MSSDNPSPSDVDRSRETDASNGRRAKFRLGRLALKELRETLRDRRTIVTLVLMPLIVYPILSLVFKTFLLSNIGLLGSDQPIQFQIAYGGEASERQIVSALGQIQRGIDEMARVGESSPPSQAVEENRARPNIAGFTQHSWAYVNTAADETGELSNEQVVEQLVESGQADVGIFFDFEGRERWQIGRVQLVSRNEGISELAFEYLATKLKKLNEFELRTRLSRSGLPSGPILAVSNATVGPQDKESSGEVPLASLVPLILVLMTITGAVYPAIDLTAGERERGTLETLMAAPIPRMGILCSKFIAVWTVAVLTAMLNLIGMFATIWAFQLDEHFGGGMFNFTVMVKIFLLLILFAAFFSALLLAVTSFAKSFKEAQVYLIPVILLSLGPGLIAMSPDMSLDGVNAVTPMINILLLARDVIQDKVMLMPALIAIISTLIYSCLAIRWAAGIFGSDSMLFSGGGSVAEMFQRPIQSNPVVPMMGTVFCLILLFPINFASFGFLGRLPAEAAMDLQLRYLTQAVLTFIAFMMVPWIVARHQNTVIKTGFGLQSPKVIFLFAAVLLGISLWPIVMSMTAGWHEVYGIVFGSEKQDEWHDRLVETTSQQVARVRMVSPLVIVIAFSIVPAICEEWFFRGMLLRSLLKSNGVWKSILISAAVFGCFHVLSTSVIAVDRFVPSTLVGIVLGYLAYKSDSIWPGIVLHSSHNAIVIFLAYYQPRLSELAWFPAEEDPIPVSWVLAGFAVAAIGAVIIWKTRGGMESAPSTNLVSDL